MRLVLVAAAVLIAAPAVAQAPDPLCASLDKIIATADDQAPFVVLQPGFKAEDKWVAVEQKLAGLEYAEKCEIYLAGTKKLGTLSGGPHNTYSCRLASGDRRTDSRAAGMVKEILEMYAPKVSACLTAKGWTAEPLVTRESGNLGLETYRFSKPKSEIDVIVETQAEQTGRSALSANTWFTTSLAVRALNPDDPDYKKPE